METNVQGHDSVQPAPVHLKSAASLLTFALHLQLLVELNGPFFSAIIKKQQDIPAGLQRPSDPTQTGQDTDPGSASASF